MMISLQGFEGFPVLRGISDRKMSHGDFLKRLEAAASPLVRLEQVHGGRIARIDGKTDLSKEIPGTSSGRWGRVTGPSRRSCASG